MTTFKDVLLAFKQAVKERGQAKAREVLGRFGASTVSELPRAKYDDVIAALTGTTPVKSGSHKPVKRHSPQDALEAMRERAFANFNKRKPGP